MATWLNRAAVLAKLKALPEKTRERLGGALEGEVDGMVQAMKRAAPVSDDMEKQPGQFRDSIHSYKTPDRELSYRIIADATDEKGNFIGPHIEFGHLAKDGSHVPPKASFFPTYRARKAPTKRRLRAAARKALKAAAPDLVK